MLGTVYYCNTNPTTISHFTLIGDMNQLTKLPFKGGQQTQKGRWQRRCLLPGIPEAEQSSCCLPCKTFLGLHPCISIQNSFPLIPYEVVFMIFIYPIVMQTISLMSLSALSLVLNIMYLQGKLQIHNSLSQNRDLASTVPENSLNKSFLKISYECILSSLVVYHSCFLLLKMHFGEIAVFNL